MDSRLVGRWADRTASRQVCKPFRVLFCFVPLGSILIFVLFRINNSVIDAVFEKIPSELIVYIRLTQSLVLPRSWLELDAIDARFGAQLFRTTFLSETSLAMSGMCAIVITVRQVRLREINDPFSGVQLLIRLFIVICSLVIRPVSFSVSSIAVNYIDETGLFLIKESVVIAVGYYEVALILTDAFGRIVSRISKPAFDHQANVRTLNDTDS